MPFVMPVKHQILKSYNVVTLVVPLRTGKNNIHYRTLNNTRDNTNYFIVEAIMIIPGKTEQSCQNK